MLVAVSTLLVFVLKNAIFYPFSTPSENILKIHSKKALFSRLLFFCILNTK